MSSSSSAQEFAQFYAVIACIIAFIGCLACLLACVKLYTEFIKEKKNRQ